jgi:hypothetical protein
MLSELLGTVEGGTGRSGAGVATRVYSVSLGGFDLHADGRESQQALPCRLDKPLAAFAERMVGKGFVIGVYSGFERRVHPTPRTALITAPPRTCSCSATGCAVAVAVSRRV